MSRGWRGIARRGFTLIELLVVIAILGLLLGITFLTTGKQQRGAQVRQEAEILAATLRQARSMAIARRAVYAVVFNIQNEPGSSGAVLNNRSGGHWYRILGPGTSQATVVGGSYRSTTDMQDRIPYAGGATCFPDFLAEVAEAWVSEPHVLPARKVRFLALSDTDEGPVVRGEDANSAGTIRYGTGGETTYPRPWFGYYDTATQTLWPWGGYDPAKPFSGFYYQGADGAISGCVNPTTRSYNHDFNNGGSFVDVDLNSDGDVDDLREREVGFTVLTAGEPRPLVNANWLDSGIAFLPDGSAHMLEWNRSRRYYKAIQTVVPGTYATGNYGNGVRDMSKVPRGSTPTSMSLMFQSYVDPPERGVRQTFDDTAEVGHFRRHTGGWHITLAPDVLNDQVQFPTAAAALTSMTPAYRVFVGANGSVSTFYVKHQEGSLNGKTLWPANPTDWLSTSTAGTNPVWQNCRVGWLHIANTANKTSGLLVPRGYPITDTINSTMLTNKQWWIDE